MTLKIVSSYNGVSDPDAAAYISAVEAADGELLEFAVGKAINDFVLGCKADGIWPAIKASCILAGARTLNGALVPLVGAAPTNYNFVAGDYNRKTGLLGDKNTKYLNSNRQQQDDPWANKHMSLFLSMLPTVDGSAGSEAIMGGRAGAITHSVISVDLNGNVAVGLDDLSNATGFSVVVPSFVGATRSNKADMQYRFNHTTRTRIRESTGVGVNSITIFGQTFQNLRTDPRLAFYSIGEALDLAKLDARVTDLINKFQEVIP